MNNLTMNKLTNIFTRVAVAGALLVFARNAQSQLGIGNLYQNDSTFYNSYNYGNSEAGNQIILAGPAIAEINAFSFQFDFLNSMGGLTGNPSAAMADVKFYENNGTPVNGYPSPGTVLFDSGPFSIGGYTTGATENFYGSMDDFTGTGIGIVGGGAGVIVPKNFTWTVTFSGLTGGDTAGLAIYYQPTVGSDALPNGDGWVNLGMGLVPGNVTGMPDTPLEFGAVFATVPDSACLSISVMSVLAGFGWMKRFQRRA
jgi:hypothetical protein